MMPLVTVAIPTYNRPTFLREALDSVLMQSLQDFNILVVDDKSPYDVESLVEDYHDPRIRLLRQPSNVGVRRNWRTALCTPATRYVAFLEDDNLWLPHHLQQAIDALEQHPDATFYSCSVEWFGENTGIFKPCWSTGDALDVCQWQHMGYAVWLRGCPIQASSVVLRRDALEGLFWGGRSWPWCPEYLWCGQLALQGAFLFNGRVGVRYRWHDANDTYGHRNSKGKAHWLYVIRELAKRAYAAGGLRDLATETREFPAAALSVLIIALSAPDSPPDLVRQARRIFEARRDLATQPGCALNFRLATRLGGWWLRWADPQTRLLARWWPVAAW
jgi:glycosyltransferase involved in cell wall biosynthesis